MSITCTFGKLGYLISITLTTRTSYSHLAPAGYAEWLSLESFSDSVLSAPDACGKPLEGINFELGEEPKGDASTGLLRKHTTALIRQASQLCSRQGL